MSDYLPQNPEDVKDFEKGRIRALQEERLHIQKKTFTKWMNSFLLKGKMEVEDLFTDLADGRKLLKLLEIISGEKLGKPNSGKMRVHRIENVNKSLAFLHTKVRLENIGAEDIVDGNPRMILGLIWTIILRFQIQEIEIDVDEDDDTSTSKKSAKEALLLWCQRKTNGYKNVAIRDFSSSWQSGLGFNALIHSHRPDLVNFNNLDKDDNLGNLRSAFDIAEKHLGIPRLLDAEDVDVSKPDEKSVITYVASCYHTFSKMKAGATGGKRIGNIVMKIKNIEDQQASFESYSTNLLLWIQDKTVQMQNRDFSNNLDGIQVDFRNFKDYRTVEKPPKYREKVEIEATYFDIQIKRQQLRQAAYVPPEGQRPHDIDLAWVQLEKQEYLLEVALKEELLRQEKLEQLALKYERKSVLRDGYLNEMIGVLSDPRYGSNLQQVDASVKKHEAISADILARQERFLDLKAMSSQLQQDRYWKWEEVRDREIAIMQRWDYLLELLRKHREKLERYSSIITMQREIDTLAVTIQMLKQDLETSESGSHLLDVQEKLQKFQIQESQVNAMAETIKKVSKQCKSVLSNQELDEGQGKVIQSKMEELENQFKALLALTKKRQVLLEDSLSFYELIQDFEEEGQWCDEKLAVCSASITAKDLRALTSLQQKHKALEDEMVRRHNRFLSGPLSTGQDMISNGNPLSDQLEERIKVVQAKWAMLKEEAAKKRVTLESATDAYLFFSDCNETDSVIKESITLAKSRDFGQDKLTALSLLQRHKHLQDKIQSIEGDVSKVEVAGDKLKNSHISDEALYLTADPAKNEDSEKLVATEVWEDEPFERTEIQKVIEERKVPQVKSLYPYQGHGLDVKKGEVMFLLDKTNQDWWNIRKNNGENGFVPANYVKEIDPKLVSVEVKKPIVVKDVRKVKKTQYIKQKVPQNNLTSGKDIIGERQNAIKDSYDLLKKLSRERQEILQNSLRLFDYYSECEDFNKWMKDRSKAITADENDVVKATKAFEKFLTDFSANKKRLEQIDIAAKELEIIFPELKKDVSSRDRETHKIYDGLVKLQEQQEKNLEGSASVIFFQKSCEDVCDWITEKSEKLEMDDLAKDLTTVKALQRKHKGIERELAPIKDKVGQVTQLGQDVIDSFPAERGNIEKKTTEVQEKWEMLENKAKERSKRLEDAVGMQLFTSGVKTLQQWVDTTKNALNANEHVRDVQTAEELLNKHAEIGDEIRNKQDEFGSLIQLGQKMYERQPSQDIEEKINSLGEERKAVLRGWQEKGDWLRQVRDLQLFNREADQVDASTSAQAKLLDNMGAGDSLPDVEASLKRHEDSSATVNAQEDRVGALVEMANRLLEAGHYSNDTIMEKKDKIEKAREMLKQKSANKRGELDENKLFQEFKTEVEEMNKFVTEKKKLVREDSFRDGTNNMKAKIKKHQVLDGEIKANAGQLKALNKTGQQMINRNHFKAKDIEEELAGMNSSWENLVEAVRDQGTKFGQAEAQNDFNRMTGDIKTKLGDIKNLINSTDTGEDMRGCKKLLSQHAAAEAELTGVEQKVGGLDHVASDLAEGHFDGASILSNCRELRGEVELLKGPLEMRKSALNLSMKFHEFNFDLQRELEWISEKMTIVSAPIEIQTLHQAQTSAKKHRKLEEEVKNHSVVVDNVVDSGKKLTDPSYVSDVNANSENLTDTWKRLLSAVDGKGSQLKLMLVAQQFYFEVSEVENWINDKTQTIQGAEYGNDEDNSIKMLTKHKTMELEIDTYSGIIQEISATATKLVNNNHPDSKQIKNRDDVLNRELKKLRNTANVRRDRLVATIQLHEYSRESGEFLEWIREMMAGARSEETGQDYEHLEILLARFQQFKLKVQAGEEKFKTCESLAKRLDTLDKDASSMDVKEMQASLMEEWMALIEAIQERDTKLESAGEIHRFNRDIAEALSRIGEKSAILETNDTGRDTKSAQSHLRRHEGFENDLVALEAQLQVLIDDSAALQARYPDKNGQHVALQQKTVLQAWNELQEKAADRKAALMSSNDYHTFMGMVRDLLAWSSGLRRTLTTEEKVSDAASAQMLKTEHDNLKAEIETREKTFSEVVALGEAMVGEEHSAIGEIKEKIDSVLTERQKLHTAWQHKKVYLDQLIDVHFYLRDVKQILATSTAQEIALSNTECGHTIEEVEAHLKAHDAFKNLVAKQEEKVESLKEHAEKLIKQKHFDRDTIKAKLEEVLEKRENISMLCTHKTNLMNLKYLYAKFIQDANIEITWVEEKKRKLLNDNKTYSSSLTEKTKLHQKHQALQAEIEIHKPQITFVCTRGNRLVQKKHENSQEITETLNTLVRSWENLQHESGMISKGLEEAKGILDFNNEVSKIEAWIRDKELLVSQGDLGKDYEHCTELQKKLDDVNSDMRVDASRIKKINQMAVKLCSEAGSETDAIEAKKNEIDTKFKNLQESIENYRQQLSVSGNMHAFQRDTDETLTRIKEKLLIIDINDKGKDLKDVQELSKKLDSVTEYLSSMSQRITDHKSDAATLTKKYPDMLTAVKEKMEILEDIWANANKKIDIRRRDLENSMKHHQFVFNCKEFQVWLLDMDKKIKSVVAPNSVAEADAIMSLHQERKSELNGRRDMFEKLKSFGEHLIAEKHMEAENIEVEIEKTLEIRENVEQSWEDTKHQIQQGHQLFTLKQQHIRTVAWIEEKEAFLNNDDLGDSIGAVEALIRKHDGFVITMDKQGLVVNELENTGQFLIKNDHFDADMILNMIKSTRVRMEMVKEKSVQRLKKLEDSRCLYQFLRKVYDIKSWVKEKTQVALDESYYDLSNLENKIQKHASFEAEIEANKPRLLAINDEGEQLCRKSHFASQEIANQLEDLQSEWNHLQETSNLKKSRLYDANTALIYLHGLDEFDSWLEDNEGILESADHGKDLNSVSKLLKKLQATEADIFSRKDTLKTLEEQYEKFETSNHFMLEELEQRFSSIHQRYEALHEPVQIRRENLEDSLLLHQFNREVADETIWLEEKLPLASSSHLGNSLSEVQNLQQKHQILESEIHSHDRVVNSLINKAEQMVRSNHFAGDDIKETMKHLNESYKRIRDISSLRKLRLNDAEESQQFYTKLNESFEWIKEKEPILKVRDIKDDEDSVQIYLKKVNDIIVDAENHEQKLNEMRISSERMVERGHFDSSNIQQKMHELNRYFDNFRKEIVDQKQRLLDQKAVIEFFHETEEVNEWVNTQMTVAASEDYGKDVSHVEMLIKTFDSFMQTIISSEERIVRVTDLSTKLITENNTHKDIIVKKTKEINQLWEDLKELAIARHEALSGAKQVHVFDKNADETISWIGEKEAEISMDEVGQDLETIQSLIERQEGFQRDLAVIQQQVAAVEKEASVLCELFPDAAAHIDAKREDTSMALVNLLHMSSARDEKLKQNQQIQRYFDDYRELMAWASEVMAKITSPDLASDQTGAETLISRHKEIKSEIDARLDSFNQFETSGNELISGGHFMSSEILEKISVLNTRKEKMFECWSLREEIYSQHLDYLVWAKETDAVEYWMSSREPHVMDKNFGNNILEVEELIKRQQDFEGAISAKEGDLENVHRITMIEQNFAALREREEASKHEEVIRKEQERLDGIKKKELTRITNERRRENERRRTQEIKFNREDFEQIRATQVNGKSEVSGSVSPANEESFSFSKRGESMRLEPKQHKRTPSFTTRRRTQSFRRHTKNLNTVQNLPPVEVDGFLDRKQELQTGGKRATIRSWKSYYTVLCGQLMCFFRDQEDFFESKAASSPIMIYQASVETANDYTKRNFVFRLHSTDGSEFLFGADSEEQQQEWVKKIKFHAGLPPSQQLTSYKTFDESNEAEGSPPQKVKSNDEQEPVYANLPVSKQPSPKAHVSPPLPDTQPPVWPDAGGAAGARQALNTSSRSSLQPTGSSEADGAGPVYANVGQIDGRRNTLPVQSNRNSGVPETDKMDTISQSGKEKKGSVLGRFLGRKK